MVEVYLTRKFVSRHTNFKERGLTEKEGMIVKANLIACVILGDSRTKKCNVINKGNRDWKGLSVFPLKTLPFLFPGLENMIWEVEISYKTTQTLCSPVTMMLNLKNSNLQKGHSTLQLFPTCSITSSWQGPLHSSAPQGLLIPLHPPPPHPYFLTAPFSSQPVWEMWCRSFPPQLPSK